MSQGPVSISSKEQFTGILRSSKIVVADCTDKTRLHATTHCPASPKEQSANHIPMV